MVEQATGLCRPATRRTERNAARRQRIRPRVARSTRPATPPQPCSVLLFNSAFFIFNCRMITRYSRPEMRMIWTDENKLKIWLQIELLASEALVKEGIVPRKDFAMIKTGCDKWFADLPGLVERQKHHEKVLNHD